MKRFAAKNTEEHRENKVVIPVDRFARRVTLLVHQHIEFICLLDYILSSANGTSLCRSSGMHQNDGFFNTVNVGERAVFIFSVVLCVLCGLY